MRSSSVLVTLVVSSLFFVAGHQDAHAQKGETRYKAQVMRTSYGIPHIQATDWGSLGYGYGYVFAEDNFCVLAREVLTANGSLSRYFGVGSGNANIISDWTYAMVNADSRVNPAYASLDSDTVALLKGYADGYNRYLRDKGAAAGAAECRGAEWVRPITDIDVYKVLRKLLVRAGTGNFAAALVGAAPPAVAAAADAPSMSPAGVPMEPEAARLAAEGQRAADSARLLAAIDAAELPDFSPERFGSNALALGSDLTGGSGALLGNPHFPWFGIERFYAVHLTIPGRYDMMGGSIYGFPLVNIGFNRDVAWSHTVSTARRFVLRELTLVPGNPTAYMYDGQAVQMQPEVVTVQAMVAPGVVVPVPHTFYQTQFGPAVIVPPLAQWTTQKAYAFTDVNLDNTRAFQLYREMGAARSVDELSQALNRHVALPWVNTIAADRHGNAYYGDITVVPNVSNAKLIACANTQVAQTLSFGARVYTLDGSTSACDPGTDADAPAPGIFGPGNLPSLTRRDYVHNANDSYWLSNPEARLEGFSMLIGADENRPQNFRTRLGHTQVEDRLAGDDLPGAGFDRQWLQDALFGNRHYSPEIMLDDVLTVCAENGPTGQAGGAAVDVTAACGVLANWDRRNKVTSVGAHVWTVFWGRLASASGLYAVPFDPADPVNTPRSVNLASGAVRTRIMNDLAATVKFFTDNGIPLDRPWGQVQFDLRNGEAIPIHGGSGGSGVWNAIVPGPLAPGVGYAPIFGGSSYIQAVTFRPNGPDARAIVTYSQSTDPENPHYADMTKLYSQSGWVTMPYAMGDIRRDPNLKVFTLTERR
jgi:acyl-homoserine-lactone acylase